MSVKTRSARGEVVDFDLLKIKEQIAANPAPTDVKARQNFVDRRLRRRVKSATERAEFSKAMPTTEDLSEEEKLIDVSFDEDDIIDDDFEEEEEVVEEKPRRRTRKTQAPK